MGRPSRTLALLSLASFLVACGGGEAAEPEAATPEPMTSGDEAGEGPRGGMQVEGTLGTIPPSKIEDAMQSRMPGMRNCMFEGWRTVDFLGGRIKLAFRVDESGTVEWVYPVESTLGHRETEQCIADVAKGTRFPKPRGGSAAEFSWGFEVDVPGDVRPPLSFDEARVHEAVRASEAALAACELGSGRYRVTAYIAPGGAVMAAGAQADSADAAQKLECVVSAVRGVVLPDPGSYPAKVSFTLY